MKKKNQHAVLIIKNHDILRSTKASRSRREKKTGKKPTRKPKPIDWGGVMMWGEFSEQEERSRKYRNTFE